MKMYLLQISMLAAITIPSLLPGAEQPRNQEMPDNFRKENLIAWCIVPFDSQKRNPAERAEMLVELGLRRVAYDWRQEHIPEFEQEILQYSRHGLEYFAFWNEHEEAFKLFEKHGLQPQVWKTNPSPKTDDQKERIQMAADMLAPLAARTARLGSSMGLYNHGGWGGEPENLVAVCRELHRRGYKHVGIAYNFHHAHDQVDRFPEVLDMVKPYLLCMNLNGMVDSSMVDEKSMKNKIVPLGSGQHEAKMIRQIIHSGYDGPIGILGHIATQDVAKSLQDNLKGLEGILAEIYYGN